MHTPETLEAECKPEPPLPAPAARLSADTPASILPGKGYVLAGLTQAGIDAFDTIRAYHGKEQAPSRAAYREARRYLQESTAVLLTDILSDAYRKNFKVYPISDLVSHKPMQVPRAHKDPAFFSIRKGEDVVYFNSDLFITFAVEGKGTQFFGADCNKSDHESFVEPLIPGRSEEQTMQLCYDDNRDYAVTKKLTQAHENDNPIYGAIRETPPEHMLIGFTLGAETNPDLIHEHRHAQGLIHWSPVAHEHLKPLLAGEKTDHLPGRIVWTAKYRALVPDPDTDRSGDFLNRVAGNKRNREPGM